MITKYLTKKNSKPLKEKKVQFFSKRPIKLVGWSIQVQFPLFLETDRKNLASKGQLLLLHRAESAVPTAKKSILWPPRAMDGYCTNLTPGQTRPVSWWRGVIRWLCYTGESKLWMDPTTAEHSNDGTLSKIFYLFMFQILIN